MSDEKYEYTRTQLISGNVALLLWIAVASVTFWFYNPLTFWFFLIFAAFMVFAILRRMGCSTCAYCKSCTMGFGRLSAWFFGKRSNKDTRNKAGLAMVVIIYGLLAVFTLVPLLREYNSAIVLRTQGCGAHRRLGVFPLQRSHMAQKQSGEATSFNSVNPTFLRQKPQSWNARTKQPQLLRRLSQPKTPQAQSPNSQASAPPPNSRNR